jgi:hypothetical protein
MRRTNYKNHKKQKKYQKRHLSFLAAIRLFAAAPVEA